jgi:hypothetical protein
MSIFFLPSSADVGRGIASGRKVLMTTQRKLPANPNLTQLKKQAKELRQAVGRSDSDAVDRVRSFHPTISMAPDRLDIDSFTLRDAQATLAREYGFDGWHQLNTAVGEMMVDERDLHRWFGVQINNGIWETIENPDAGPTSPLEEREMMLYSAYASAYHWRQVGSPANFARGEHLISRAATKVGEKDLALRHARRCLELVDTFPDEMEDWDAPFAHEALARALAATGDVESGRRHLATAESLTSSVRDPEDRAVLEVELARDPWFGLK